MMRTRRARFSFDEERQPCGVTGLRSVARSLDRVPPALDDCLVSRPRPWLLVIWEPLLTKAPAPPRAAPYCCYIKTVIFYHSPYIVRPWKRLYRSAGNRLRACEAGFEEWDKIETRLSWDDLVVFDGETFQIGGGTVVWAKRRWWMRRGARRYQAPERVGIEDANGHKVCALSPHPSVGGRGLEQVMADARLIVALANGPAAAEFEARNAAPVEIPADEQAPAGTTGRLL